MLLTSKWATLLYSHLPLTSGGCIPISTLLSILRPSSWNKNVREQGLWRTQQLLC